MTDWSGTFIIEFMNGNIESFIIERTVFDNRGCPIFFETNHGAIYNWQNILSIRRKSDASQ